MINISKFTELLWEVTTLLAFIDVIDIWDVLHMPTVAVLVNVYIDTSVVYAIVQFGACILELIA